MVRELKRKENMGKTSYLQIQAGTEQD